MELIDIKNALLTIDVPVFHYHAKTKENKYIVWAEEGEGKSLSAGNKKQVQTKTGTIDYFTKEEYDSNFDAIQNSLNVLEIGWYWNSTQYEKDTEYIHHEWVWEML